MQTKFFEIVKSDEQDVKNFQVPPFQVWAIGEDFSRPVGYFDNLDDAIQNCKDSGHAYKVHGSLLRESEVKIITDKNKGQLGNWFVYITKDHSWFENINGLEDCSGILYFENDTLVDFDGMFELPSEVVEIVKTMGYSVDL